MPESGPLAASSPRRYHHDVGFLFDAELPQHIGSPLINVACSLSAESCLSSSIRLSEFERLMDSNFIFADAAIALTRTLSGLQGTVIGNLSESPPPAIIKSIEPRTLEQMSAVNVSRVESRELRKLVEDLTILDRSPPEVGKGKVDVNGLIVVPFLSSYGYVRRGRRKELLECRRVATLKYSGRSLHSRCR